jgi:hypothetical protein
VSERAGIVISERGRESKNEREEALVVHESFERVSRERERER